MNTKQTKEISKLYHKICDINEASDLRREKLSLSDLLSVQDIFNKISRGDKAETISENASNFFKKYGANVKNSGIGFVISV